jgi:hypothetical protein
MGWAGGVDEAGGGGGGRSKTGERSDRHHHGACRGQGHALSLAHNLSCNRAVLNISDLSRNRAVLNISDVYQPYICFVHNQDEKRDGRMFCFLCDFLSSFMINMEALKGASFFMKL